MSPITVLIILLFFNALGRYFSPPHRPHYHSVYDHDFRRPSMHQHQEEERHRHAFSYTLVFVALLVVAMYLAHDLWESEAVVALK